MMQIRRLEVERYKVFSRRAAIDIRPLTILVGRNNSGKSALLRAIPLLAGGLASTARPDEPLPLEGHGLVHGKSFEDLLTNRSVHGRLGLAATYGGPEDPVHLETTIQNLVGPGHQSQPCIAHWRLRFGPNWIVNLERTSFEFGNEHYKVTIQIGQDEPTVETLPIQWTGLIPDTQRPPFISKSWALSPVIESLRSWAGRVRFLCSPRRPIESSFPMGRERSGVGMSDGGDAPLSLASSNQLLSAVRAWYEATFDVSLHLREMGEYYKLETQVGDERGSVLLSQSGQGLAQLLPVVVQRLTTDDLGSGIDIIEHPEAELHPGAHGAVADLLISTLRGEARPLLVETHSEMLLLRVRRKIAEGVLSPDDVAVYWIDDEDDAQEHVRRVTMTPEGDVGGWPEGVFYEDYEEILAIRRAARDRYSS
jgi:hypothetical protein